MTYDESYVEFPPEDGDRERDTPLRGRVGNSDLHTIIDRRTGTQRERMYDRPVGRGDPFDSRRSEYEEWRRSRGYGSDDEVQVLDQGPLDQDLGTRHPYGSRHPFIMKGDEDTTKKDLFRE